MEQSILSTLKLNNLVFDELHFNRMGFKNDEEFSMKITVQIGCDEDQCLDIVSVTVNIFKHNEYELKVKVSGYFETKDVEDSKKQSLLEKNAVAILMPYIRSEITILTAQPDTEPLVLPVLNIEKMVQLNQNNIKT